MGLNFNFKEIFSAFMVLFAIIDITGSIPIFLDIKEKGHKIESAKAAIISTLLFIVFLFLGDAILGLFGVDISSFAVAGSIIILILASEMILDIEIFKYQGPSGSATLTPVVFPLIAGPGSLTTVLSLRAEYAVENIIVAILLNMIIAFLVISKLQFARKIIGEGGTYLLRKFFGIILLAIAIKLFTTNIVSLF